MLLSSGAQTNSDLTTRLFSDSGRSYSFDDRGTGFGRGEGCGVIVLKPLEQARKDNDSIRAVIMGSGINQDGRTPGITMPCGTAQGESICNSPRDSTTHADMVSRDVDEAGV